MRTDIEQLANEPGFAIELRLTVEAVIEALKVWLTRQTDQAVISATLILTRSLSTYLKHPSDSLLKQIAANAASLESAVRADR